MGSLDPPQSVGVTLPAASLAPKTQLPQSLISFFLGTDVCPNHGPIPTGGRCEVDSCSEVVSGVVVMRPILACSHQINRALALDDLYHIRHCILRQNRDHPRNTVAPHISVFYPALLLLGQSPKHLA